MKAATLALMLALPAVAQEYIQTYYKDAPPTNPAAKLVQLDERSERLNPDFSHYNGRLARFFPGAPFPLLVPPAGSVISLTDGTYGTNVTDLATKRDVKAPAAKKLRAMLGTNTYNKAVKAQLDILRVTLTNETVVTRRAATRAQIELFNLQEAHYMRKLERERLGIKEDEPEESAE